MTLTVTFLLDAWMASLILISCLSYIGQRQALFSLPLLLSAAHPQLRIHQPIIDALFFQQLITWLQPVRRRAAAYCNCQGNFEQSTDSDFG